MGGMNEATNVKIKVALRLEKYHGDVAQEDIDAGRVKPYEVIVTEDEISDVNVLKIFKESEQRCR